jgi:RNase H-fold protein (predicted Holliday junction resolvase)
MSTLPEKARRILALDVRSHRIGYAVFEPPDRLLDFGVTRFKASQTAVPRIASLIRKLRPSVLVLRKLARNSSRNRPGTQTILRSTRNMAKHFSIDVSLVSENRLAQTFTKKGANTKYQVASLLAKDFPELGWRLPPKRKPWHGQHLNMSIFDAAALGIVHLASENVDAA